MNHQPYVDWLFTTDESGEGALTPQQKVELQEHLLGCELCRSTSNAWSSAEAHLLGKVMIAPQPGFTIRWEARLEAERKAVHQRQIRAMLAFSIGGALSLLVILAILTWPWLRSPSVLLWTWIYHLFTLYSYAEVAQDFLINLLQTTAGAISVFGIIIFMGLLSELGVLWVVSFRLLTNPRRIIR